MQPISHKRSSIILSRIKNYLSINWSKHISVRYEQAKLLLGNFPQNGIFAHADIEHEFLLLHLHHFDFDGLLLLIDGFLVF